MYLTPSQPKHVPIPLSEIESEVVGGWDGIASHRYLELDSREHKATFFNFAASTEPPKSYGTWHLDGKMIVVQVTGDGGDYEERLELVKSLDSKFLTPAPATRSLLRDSWQFDQSEEPEY